MIKRLKAIFDGDVLRPIERLDLEPNTEVEITLDIPDASAPTNSSFLDVAENLNLVGPSDWSVNNFNAAEDGHDNPRARGCAG